MKPFKPHTLPLRLDWTALLPEISLANRVVGHYNQALAGLPDPFLMLRQLALREAVDSTRIEGTQASAEDVMEYHAFQEARHASPLDVEEVTNYLEALHHGAQAIKEKPFGLNLLKELHFLLLKGVRGDKKARGSFRPAYAEVYIGRPGATMREARYIPPQVDDMLPALDNWEQYFHFEEVDPLVQLAVLHAQFEIIHPFLDGNGRLGRLIIPLFLFQKGILSTPVFYLSGYLLRHRDAYMDHLKAISDTEAWEPWIQFFLRGIIEQGREDLDLIKRINALHVQMMIKVPDVTRSHYAHACVDFLFRAPLFSSTQFRREAGIPEGSINRLLTQLRDEGIIDLARKGAGRKPAMYRFAALIELVQEEKA